MEITRRDLLKYLGASAAALGLSGVQLRQAEVALAAASSPPVIWLNGASCTGCSVSVLNVVGPTISEVLTQTISLRYSTTLMAAAGDVAITAAKSTAQAAAGSYILVVEGAIPTASEGKYAYVWDENGRSVTMAEAVKTLAASAKYVLAVGTCSSFGGIPRVNTSASAKGVSDYLREVGVPIANSGEFGMGIVSSPSPANPVVVNLPGCAPHPDWVIGSIAKILAGTPPRLDRFGRPVDYYKEMPIHERCPRRMRPQATQFGQDGLCVIQLGCKGPIANADCETRLWNNRNNWCIGANGLCLACVQPDFPSFPFHSKNTHMLMG